MKFSSREDIEAPIEYVFDQVTDFPTFERAAMRRGADVTQVAGKGAAAVGSVWDVSFEFRGKPRKIKAEITEMDHPNGYKAHSTYTGLVGTFELELVPLSPNRTRLAVSLELEPQGLSARLMLQSLKLAKASLTRRFKLRIADFAETIQSRYS
ncbi:SRPBCC family protein [Aestuariibius sp. HNIBRBA575]|uniref:SRPBCC family protein n=1 Tax=Aestuariibius sp. HNIBRBA575 TaxID=3233343 RepID=UPI0034A44676